MVDYGRGKIFTTRQLDVLSLLPFLLFSLIYDVFFNKALQVFDDDEKDKMKKNMKPIINFDENGI